MALFERAQWAAGIACICSVAVLWTGAAVLKQMIFQDFNFDKPLMLSYVCNACYIFHCPIYLLGRCCGWQPALGWESRTEEEILRNDHGQERDRKVVHISGLREAMVAGLAIAPIWFLAQWTYNSGVAYTSVTSSTVISSTSVVWTFVSAVLFTGEKARKSKALGVTFCLVGNVLTQVGDSKGGGSQATSEAKGDLLCLAGAVLYAAYTTVLKKMARDDISVVVLFGTIGVVVAVAVLPIVAFVEPESLDMLTWKIFGLLVFNGLFDNVLSQYLWAKGVQWISATAATVGLSLTIPLSIVSDVIRGKPPSFWSYLAAIFVVAGFVLVTAGASSDRRDEETAAAAILESHTDEPFLSLQAGQEQDPPTRARPETEAAAVLGAGRRWQEEDVEACRSSRSSETTSEPEDSTTSTSGGLGTCCGGDLNLEGDSPSARRSPAGRSAPSGM